ncbi:hypothetical protein BGZ47_006686 [Haplosporangium gracile]|nr:hypothetical protein BGZ47_006686 [Haplosporangium gracile]
MSRVLFQARLELLVNESGRVPSLQNLQSPRIPSHNRSSNCAVKVSDCDFDEIGQRDVVSFDPTSSNSSASSGLIGLSTESTSSEETTTCKNQSIKADKLGDCSINVKNLFIFPVRFKSSFLNYVNGLDPNWKYDTSRIETVLSPATSSTSDAKPSNFQSSWTPKYDPQQLNIFRSLNPLSTVVITSIETVRHYTSNMLDRFFDLQWILGLTVSSLSSENMESDSFAIVVVAMVTAAVAYSSIPPQSSRVPRGPTASFDPSSISSAVNCKCSPNSLKTSSIIGHLILNPLTNRPYFFTIPRSHSLSLFRLDSRLTNFHQCVRPGGGGIRKRPKNRVTGEYGIVDDPPGMKIEFQRRLTCTQQKRSYGVR